MSRTVVEREAATNNSKSIRENLTWYLSQCPPAEGYEIRLELESSEECHFNAIIRGDSPKAIRPPLIYALSSVPTIQEHFGSTGALKLAWTEFQEGQKADAARAYERLFNEPLPETTTITQTVGLTIKRAKR